MIKKKLEQLYNETFAGLALFYRDTTLSQNLISKYQVGQIIKNPAFTDMTYKGGGLKSNFRYLIASAFGKNVSAFNPEAARTGLTILNSGAYFKVLDIYETNDKTQVFLLNIPEHAINLFYSMTTNIEKNIIKKARNSFDTKKDKEPLEELQTLNWQDRTSFPIGMSDDGILYFDNSQLERMTTDQLSENETNT